MVTAPQPLQMANTSSPGAKLNVSTVGKPLTSNTVTFFKPNGEQVGEFNFDQTPAWFKGAVDESAKLFVNAVLKLWSESLLGDQKERLAKLVDHILAEGGGTYGDVIRREGAPQGSGGVVW